MRVLFVHGAGGFVEDRPLADALGAALGAPVDMPRLPDDDMTLGAWTAPVRSWLATAGEGDVVVGHSFGATAVLRVLADGVRTPGPVALLAMPDWGPQGWDVPEYVFDLPTLEGVLTLHHCRDDEEVPFPHLELNAARLPAAGVRAHASGGHQFEGAAQAVAVDLTLNL